MEKIITTVLLIEVSLKLNTAYFEKGLLIISKKKNIF